MGIEKDKFGFRKYRSDGRVTNRSRAAAMYERGATKQEVEDAGLQAYGTLRDAKSRGHQVLQRGDTIFLVPKDKTNIDTYIEADNEIEPTDTEEGPVFECTTEDTSAETISRTGFSVEKDQQNALRRNLDALESGLKEADGGREFGLRSGRVDVTARDTNGKLCIIELKAGTASEKAISQIASYMGAAHEEHSEEVRGIVVARDFSDKAVYAARMTKNLELKTYNIFMSFEEAV